MCLNKIRNKLYGREYANYNEMLGDLQLMVDNCIIQRNSSNFNYVGNDEIEVNFHTLPDHVMSEIQDFVNKVNRNDKGSGEKVTVMIKVY